MTRTIAGMLVTALMASGTAARSQPDADPIGVRGGVANHEGTPLTEGAVTLQSWNRSVVTTSLDQSGRFQVVPTVAGRHRLTIAVPGYAPRLVDVMVPSSRTIALPTLLLEAPASFRAGTRVINFSPCRHDSPGSRQERQPRGSLIPVAA